jgi:hypothetical protein
MHKPLLIGILFPFIRLNPWQLRNTPKMYAMGRQLRALHQNEEVVRRNLLHQFWYKCLRLRNMLTKLVRKVLYIPINT